jgi:endo-1,4-beta-xylanase
MMITRREALTASLQFAAHGALLNVTARLVSQTASPQMVLKAAGARRGCLVGIFMTKALLQDPAAKQFIVNNFNLITAGGMKWGEVHPEPDSYNFAEADSNLDFAEKTGMHVHGHNLCWNSNNPPWLKSVLNRSNAKEFLTSHITTVMKRYKGRVESWDVVNEPVATWSKRSDWLYPGIWLDLLGPEYIDIAFHAAALADPKPLRILNIHHVEHDTPEDKLALSSVMALLKQLVARGVPIQAVAFESHLDAAQPLGRAPFLEGIKEIRGLGLAVLITELDVTETRTTANPHDWDETVARYYGDYLAEVMPVANPKFVIFWSLQDRWENGRRIPGLTWGDFKPGSSYSAAVLALQKGSTTGF